MAAIKRMGWRETLPDGRAADKETEPLMRTGLGGHLEFFKFRRSSFL